jgi:hypothetical protein
LNDSQGYPSKFTLVQHPGRDSQAPSLPQKIKALSALLLILLLMTPESSSSACSCSSLSGADGRSKEREVCKVLGDTLLLVVEQGRQQAMMEARLWL